MKKLFLICLIIATMASCADSTTEIVENYESINKLKKEKVMGKIVTIPTGVSFNKTWIDVGTVTDLGNNQLEISDISTTTIKNVINETVTTVGGLCLSSNVNRYALFCPDTASPHSLGDFAGYNHTALPPTWYYNKVTVLSTQKIKVSDTEYYFDVSTQLKRGERYPITFPNATNADWQYIRVTASLYDATLDRTLTNYTIIAVGSDENPDLLSNATIRLTDIDHQSLSGTLTISAKYVSYNNIEKGNIEDIHPAISASIEGVYIYYYPADFSSLAMSIAYAKWYNTSTFTYRTAEYGNYSNNNAPQIRILDTVQLPTVNGNSVDSYFIRWQLYTPNGTAIDPPAGGLENEQFVCFYISNGSNHYKVTKVTKYLYDKGFQDIIFKTDVAYSTVITKVANIGD